MPFGGPSPRPQLRRPFEVENPPKRPPLGPFLSPLLGVSGSPPFTLTQPPSASFQTLRFTGRPGRCPSAPSPSDTEANGHQCPCADKAPPTGWLSEDIKVLCLLMFGARICSPPSGCAHTDVRGGHLAKAQEACPLPNPGVVWGTRPKYLPPGPQQGRARSRRDRGSWCPACLLSTEPRLGHQFRMLVLPAGRPVDVGREALGTARPDRRGPWRGPLMPVPALQLPDGLAETVRATQQAEGTACPIPPRQPVAPPTPSRDQLPERPSLSRRALPWSRQQPLRWALGLGPASPALLSTKTLPRGQATCRQPRVQGQSPAAGTFTLEPSLGRQVERNFLLGEKIQACGAWG